MCSTPDRRRIRSGFTLIELLVVIAVIAILAGVGIPTWLSMQKKAAIDSTRTLVNAVATAISSYAQRTWQVSIKQTSGAGVVTYEPRIGRLFDLNSSGAGLTLVMKGDGILDGDPVKENAATAGSFATDIIDSGYTGFITMTQPPIAKRNVNPQKQVVDAWKKPLRINFGSEIYGPAGFGIWSEGPDKQPNTPDDITSWESGQHAK